MIGLRGGVVLPRKSSRVEICIAVADRARGRTTWVRSLPGGEGTGAGGPKTRPRNLREGKEPRTPTAGGTPGAGGAGWG